MSTTDAASGIVFTVQPRLVVGELLRQPRGGGRDLGLRLRR